MPKYKVYFKLTYNGSIEVEAENDVEAMGKAMDKVDEIPDNRLFDDRGVDYDDLKPELLRQRPKVEYISEEVK